MLYNEVDIEPIYQADHAPAYCSYPMSFDQFVYNLFIKACRQFAMDWQK